ncbi:unnamed protein product [Parnassius mnemosyne]|uniref:Secreted protein n=1 Tax=Parnassius mnemosyne TaxID=213953 RepID=A0AAV1KTD0_9NEOP
MRVSKIASSNVLLICSSSSSWATVPSSSEPTITERFTAACTCAGCSAFCGATSSAVALSSDEGTASRRSRSSSSSTSSSPSSSSSSSFSLSLVAHKSHALLIFGRRIDDCSTRRLAPLTLLPITGLSVLRLA